ncbi:MAG: radical SAM protein [Candidatus Bathyarchaeota archaeon]|nr:radical SAM protein [Candidatus Bathyarchaeota archaeon]
MRLIAPFDPWCSKICTCPSKYSLSAYTGCSHRCLYCYITSYVRDPFNARPKKDFIRRLTREMPKVERDIPIAIASSSDPYPPCEEELELTRAKLKILVSWSAKILLITHSNLVGRDIDILKSARAAVGITITTLDSELAARLEPSAPSPDKRLNTLAELNDAGIMCGARIDPIIPGINSDEKHLGELVNSLAKAGVKHVTASTYKAKPDSYRRLANAFPDHERYLRFHYWTMGESMAGSRYLTSEMRLKLIKGVKQLAEARGISFASCREGLRDYESSASCDSSHLIPNVS